MASNNMKIFLGGVLSGASETRARTIMQAARIQRVIAERWQLNHPEQWQLKHVRWFLDVHLKVLSPETQYRYWLTLQLILLRLGKTQAWEPRLQGRWISRTSPDSN